MEIAVVDTSATRRELSNHFAEGINGLSHGIAGLFNAFMFALAALCYMLGNAIVHIRAQVANEKSVVVSRLVKGAFYPNTVIQSFAGWSDGKEGKNVYDFFEESGIYRGADEDGIEPLFRSR